MKSARSNGNNNFVEVTPIDSIKSLIFNGKLVKIQKTKGHAEVCYLLRQ